MPTAGQLVTSQGYRPGFSASSTPYGIDTHQNWIDAFVDYMSSKWAWGDRTLPQGWDTSLDGQPNANTTLGAPDAATQLAFSRYAARYRPGMDSTIDQTMPWIQPGPNDFVEDPAITAARVAQDNWERTFGQSQSNADRLAWQQSWANQLQQYGYDVAAAADRNNFAASLFDAASGNWRASQDFARGIYSTQANLWQEATQAAQSAYETGSGNWRAGLSFSQGLYDTLAGMRNADQSYNASLFNTKGQMYGTDAAFAQGVYGTQAGMYNANEANRLGALETAGGLGQQIQALWDARTNNAIQLQAHPNDFIQRESAVRALSGPQGTDVPGYKNVDALSEVLSRLIDYKAGAQPGAPVLGAQPTAPGVLDRPQAPTMGVAPSAPVIGGQPTAPVMTAAPSAPGYVAGPSAPTPTTLTQWLATNPPNPVTAATRPTTIPNYGPGGNPVTPHVQHYAMGGTTDRDQFITGDPQSDGGPNPEMVQIINPGPRTRTRVTPLRYALGLPRFAYGTDFRMSDDSGTAEGGGYLSGAPQVTLKSYSDQAYQDLPSLQYLQGRRNRQSYNTLASGYAQGAFGTQAPESGNINYGKWLDVANDPVSAALLESIYASANRDLASEVARAKARAPFGQAVNTSLVRT